MNSFLPRHNADAEKAIRAHINSMEVVAEVPPVRITRARWDQIRRIVSALAGLAEVIPSEKMPHALIQGALLADAAKEAAELNAFLEVWDQ